MKVYTVSLCRRLCYNGVGERGAISIMMVKPYKRRKYSVNQINNDFFLQNIGCAMFGVN